MRHLTTALLFTVLAAGCAAESSPFEPADVTDSGDADSHSPIAVRDQPVVRADGDVIGYLTGVTDYTYEILDPERGVRFEVNPATGFLARGYRPFPQYLTEDCSDDPLTYYGEVWTGESESWETCEDTPHG